MNSLEVISDIVEKSFPNWNVIERNIDNEGNSINGNIIIIDPGNKRTVSIEPTFWTDSEDYEIDIEFGWVKPPLKKSFKESESDYYAVKKELDSDSIRLLRMFTDFLKKVSSLNPTITFDPKGSLIDNTRRERIYHNIMVMAGYQGNHFVGYQPM